MRSDAQALKGHLDVLLLATLEDGPRHGYAVKEALREGSGGRFDLPTGSVYPALHRRAGLDADTAARSAVREFGAPDLVVAAFVRQSAGRRTARALMSTGPLVGLCWAATLAAGHAWRWPVPVPVRIATAATLLTVIAALALAATARTWRRTRIAALAGLGLVALDATLVAAVVALRPGF